ncbi:MAG: hypothetical protein IPI73_24120 [Betaproteobacteria bacterium]|nr:hypothetical protein [Betaproteobacteria bacterium]
MKITHYLPQPTRSAANRNAAPTTRASTARRVKTMCSALALIMCALSSGAIAALPVTTPGSLDPTFGAAGRVLVNPTPGDDDWGGGVLQPDGKLVVSGLVARTANTWSLAAVRVLDSGGLDPSFGAGGIATLPIDHSSGADGSPALD